MALSDSLAGVNGVLILTGASAALTAALLLWHLRFWLRPWPALLVFIFGFACVASGLLARPHILALPALEVWSAGLLRARTRGAAPSCWLLPVMTVWANSHGGFAFGLALVVPLGLEAVLADRDTRWRGARAWGLFFAAAVVAAMLTPYGWHGLVLPVRLALMAQLSGIGEWRSMNFSTLQPFEIALMALLYVGFSRGVRIPPVRLLILLGLLHMALRHSRHQMLAAIEGALILAEPLALALRQQAGMAGAAPSPGRSMRSAWTAAGIGVLIVLTTLRLSRATAIPDGFTSPVSALRQVPAELKTRPVFNDYAFGGLLMLEGIRPVHRRPRGAVWRRLPGVVSGYHPSGSGRLQYDGQSLRDYLDDPGAGVSAGRAAGPATGLAAGVFGPVRGRACPPR